MRESGLTYALFAPDGSNVEINGPYNADGYFLKSDGIMFQTNGRMQIADRAQQHGSYLDPSYKTGMTGKLEIMLIASSAAVRQSLQDDLVKLLDQFHGGAGTGYMTWVPQDSSATRVIRGLQLAEAYHFEYHAGMCKSCNILLTSEKPYSELFEPTFTDTTTITAEGSGWDIPLTIPFTLIAGGGGTSTVTNNGSVTGYPILEVYGPIDNFTISNITDNQSLEFSGAIADGNYWTIDLFERTAVDAAGNNVMTSFAASSGQWFGFKPGSTNMQLSGSNTNSNTKLRVIRADYWG